MSMCEVGGSQRSKSSFKSSVLMTRGVEGALKASNWNVKLWWSVLLLHLKGSVNLFIGSHYKLCLSFKYISPFAVKAILSNIFTLVNPSEVFLRRYKVFSFPLLLFEKVFLATFCAFDLLPCGSVLILAIWQTALRQSLASVTTPLAAPPSGDHGIFFVGWKK